MFRHSYIFMDRDKLNDWTVKHEIDIVIFNEGEKYAIELKSPFNGEYPERMFSFIKDICFMEQMKGSGFNSTYCLTLVKDKNYYSGSNQDGIYAYFRGHKFIHGLITKPTGKMDVQINIAGNYVIDWRNCGSMKYYCVSCSGSNRKHVNEKPKNAINSVVTIQKVNRKQKILEYCIGRKEKVTAKEIVAALFPGQQQSYINSVINQLVAERKLVRIDTRPYTVHVPAPGEVIGPVSDYSRKKKV